MLPQHVKQPTWHDALDFLRSIYTTASTTAAAKWSKSVFTFFLMFTGLLNTTQDPHKWFCLTAQVMGKWNWLLAVLAILYWLKPILFPLAEKHFFTLGSGWCWLLLLCSQAAAVEPEDHGEHNDKKSHQENWDNDHFGLIFTHNCQQRKKMENQGVATCYTETVCCSNNPYQ